jgi:hypothetical protein
MLSMLRKITKPFNQMGKLLKKQTLIKNICANNKFQQFPNP